MLQRVPFSCLLTVGILLLLGGGLGATGRLVQAQVIGDRIESEWSSDGKWLTYQVQKSASEFESYQVDLDQLTRLPLLETTRSTDQRDLFTRSRGSSAAGEAMVLTVHNELAEPLNLLWLRGPRDAVAYHTIAPGDQVSQPTYVGHVWSVRDETGQERLRIQGKRFSHDLHIHDELLQQYDAFRAQRRDSPPEGRRNNAAAADFFLRDHNVWQRSRDTALTSSGSADDRFEGSLLLSPSGRYLAVIQSKQVAKRTIQLIESSPADQLHPRVHELTYVKPGDDLDQPRVRIIDLETGQLVPVPESAFENAWSVDRLQWVDGPERLLCLYNRRGHQRLQVLAIDPVDGQVHAIVDETSDTFIDYSQKTYLHLLSDSPHLLWASERSGFNHLYRYDLATGQVMALTSGDWVVRGVEHVDEAAGVVWLTASGVIAGQDPYYRHLVRAALDGSDWQVVTQGDGDHQWEFSPCGRFVIDTYSRVDLPPVIQLLSLDGDDQESRTCVLSTADWSPLLAEGWSPPERFVAKGRDGETDIHGIIIRPQNFQGGRKYPIVEQIYAGPHSAFCPKSFQLLRDQRRLADQGFIVVQIDGMGTSHRGKAFHDVAYKNIKDAGFPDRKAWIRAAAAVYPEMDLDRVGIFGGSAGGQNAMRALIDHHDLYHVAVADCGCHDNRMDKIWWNEAWMGWPVDDSYADSSNVVHAHRMEGKLLLTVGELDRNVDPASTLQVVNSLIRAGKPFELLVFPGAGHGAGSSAYGVERRDEFLRRHLLGAYTHEP